MKKLLFMLVLALGPLGKAQTVTADYSAFIDLGVRWLDSRQECLAGADAAIVYYHQHPQHSVMRLRNFIQGTSCASPGGNHVHVAGQPLRSYQHSSAWRYYRLTFDGQDRCGVLYFSGQGKYMNELVEARIEDYTANRCHHLIPPAKVIITEYHSGGHSNIYYYLGQAPEEAHYTILD